MGFTILANGRSRVITAVALVALAALPLVTVQQLGDPYQAPRALVASLALVALFAAVGRVPHADRNARVGTVLVGGLIAWSLVSAIVAHPASSVWGVQGRFQGLVTLLLLALAGLAGAWLRRRELLVLSGAVGGVSIVLATVALAQVASGRIPQASFGNPTIAGAWFAVVSGLTLAAAVAAPSPRWRFAFAAAGALSVLACGVSGSRSAVLAATAGGVVVLLASRRLSARTAAVSGAALVAVLALGIALSGAGADKFAPAALLEGSARSRLEIWRGTADLVADHPALGVGSGRFLYEFPAYQPIEHAIAEGPDVRPDQAHGLPVQLAAEAGLPAALAWIALAMLALATGWRAARRGDGAALIALGGLAAYAAQGVFGVSAIETDVLGWLVAGVALTSLSAGSRDASLALRLAPAVLSLALALAIGWYVRANAAYGEGLDRFAMGDLIISAAEHERAIATDPLTDAYRVALADAAAYLDDASQAAALATLTRGLELEPRSYDLALAKARLLRVMRATPQEAARAFEDALALYPNGVTVRRETVAALRAAGRTQDANDTAELLGVLDPAADEPVRP